MQVELDNGEKWLIDVELASVEGRVACVGFRVRTYAEAAAEVDRYSVPSVEDANAEIKSTLIRTLSSGKLIDRAIAEELNELRYVQGLDQLLPDSVDTILDQVGLPNLKKPANADEREQRKHWEENLAIEKAFFGNELADLKFLEETTHSPQHTSSKGGRPPISNEVLTKVASIYTRAVRNGDRAPSKAVARELDIRHGKARRWVQSARVRGFLPPTQPRKPKATERTKETA